MDFRFVYEILVRKCAGEGTLEELGVDGGIMLDWIAVKLHVAVWTGFVWLRRGPLDQLPVTGFCEHGNEL
jgi:hypothetical protein